MVLSFENDQGVALTLWFHQLRGELASLLTINDYPTGPEFKTTRTFKNKPSSEFVLKQIVNLL